jgi:hypothetical protein
MRTLKKFFSLFTSSKGRSLTKRHKRRRNKTRINKKKLSIRRSMRGG